MAAETLKTGSLDVCPDLETMAAYLDGRLVQADRKRMAAHLESCETCYVTFIEAAQMRTPDAARELTPAPASRQPWWATPLAWSGGATLAAAASVTLLVWTGSIPWPGARSYDLQALVAATRSERTIEARLSGGFEYAPLRRTVRADSVQTAIPPAVRIAAAQIEKAAADDRSADGLRARGVAVLVAGDVDRGVAALEASAGKRPSDARLQSDLAAAYLARAGADPRSTDLANALAAANRALSLDHTLQEALFNRALALEGLAQTLDAREAWRAYLIVDDRAGWADEARSHLRALGGQR